jgi:hypothetical protein
MKFIAISSAFALVAIQASAVTIPGEVSCRSSSGFQEPAENIQGAYSVSNLGDLPEEPTDFTQPLANKLLDVLEKYGLTRVGESRMPSNFDLLTACLIN